MSNISVESREKTFDDKTTINIRRISLKIVADKPFTFNVSAAIDVNGSPLIGLYLVVFAKADSGEFQVDVSGTDAKVFETKNAEHFGGNNVLNHVHQMLGEVVAYGVFVNKIHDALDALLTKHRGRFEDQEVADRLGIKIGDIPPGVVSRWWMYQHQAHYKRPGLVKAMIFSAADDLHELKKVPNSRNVRIYLGSGNLTTITKYLKEWELKSGIATSKYLHLKDQDVFEILDEMYVEHVKSDRVRGDDKISQRSLGRRLDGNENMRKMKSLIEAWKKDRGVIL